MKKFFYTLLAAFLLTSTPVTLTSCDDDDVQAVVDLVAQLLVTYDELSNTTWITTDETAQFSFGTSNTGVFYSVDESGEAVGTNFTYSLGTDGTSITFQLENGSTSTFTIQEYTAKKSMTLVNANDKNEYYQLVYYEAK